VLAQYSGWEVVAQTGKGQGPLAVIPRVMLRRTPPPPVKVDSFSGTTDGVADAKELKGFPFTTRNKASVAIGFPRMRSKVGLSIDQPPQSAEESARPSAALSLEQRAGPARGELRLRSTGDWDLSADAEVEELGGTLRSTLRSDLDWSMDLETSYPLARGTSAAVTYGATQDGMYVKGQFAGSATPVKKRDLKADYSYMVENRAGKYSPRDLLHSAVAKLQAGDGRHQLQVKGDYNRRYPKMPVRGSVALSSRNGPLTLEASADFRRYRLRGATKHAEVAVAQDRQHEEGEAPLRELELRVLGLSAIATAGPGKPRVRLGVAL